MVRSLCSSCHVQANNNALPIGALCGATFLDNAFQKKLEANIKPATWKKLSPQQQTKTIEDGWEHYIKPDFDGSDKQWEMDLPTGGRATFSKQEIVGVFKPVVSQVAALINAQIKEIAQRKDNEDGRATPQVWHGNVLEIIS